MYPRLSNNLGKEKKKRRMIFNVLLFSHQKHGEFKKRANKYTKLEI